jgi:glycosyltransferase involved in cell wall biosynthesis
LSIRLAIDGENFAHDRRGMGRFARTVANTALADPELAVTLLYRKHSSAGTFAELFPRAAFSIKPERKAARRRAFDVCWFPWNGMRYRTGPPAVVTLHDTFAFSEPAKGRVARFREQQPIRRAARRARRVIVDSAWTAGEAVRFLDLPAERIEVIGLAPDPYFSPGRPEIEPRAIGPKRFVLFVSGREPRKNAATIFEACARALDPARETLAIAGPVSKADGLRLRAYGVPHVRIEATDAMLRSLYRGAAIVAVPSRAEGFGLVAAEAMACGAAVIASDASALPEVCGEAAVLVDPADPGAWARAIRELLDDGPLRRHYAELGRLRWDRADRDSFALRTVALLKAIAQGE